MITSIKLRKPASLLLSHTVAWPEMPLRPPRDHVHLLGSRSDYWRRVAKVLWLVASGFSLWKEIRELIAVSENVRSDSGALLRLHARLVDAEILYSALTKRNHNHAMRLVSLGPQSAELIRRLKWQPVETEWERMIRLHEKGKEGEEKHTLSVIAFAYHARLRGYQAGVMPPIPVDGFDPDVEIIQRGERVLVEVERTGYKKFSKWENMAACQGYVAFCARTKKHRARLIRENNWDLGIPGKATDLQTLFSDGWKTPYGNLWAETWS